ncbi:MAG: hypothetical protein VX796_04630 [Pseudomonadota bacterium]|nr:hypothetical protein [Pseudomonadota bacterium]
MANSEEQTNPRTASGVSLSGSEPGATTGSADRSPQGDMRDKGRETADEIRQTAQHKAEGVFDQQKGVAADQAKSLSSAFRKMAQELDDQNQGYLSGYAKRMADCTDTASERLRDQDMNGLMGQVRDYSRQQPALFMGGAVAAGFVLARFLNSSQKRDETSSPQGSGSTTSADMSSTTDSRHSSDRADKGLY